MRSVPASSSLCRSPGRPRSTNASASPRQCHSIICVQSSSTGLYLGLRIAAAHPLAGVVRAAYPRATSVHVFPAPLAVVRWRCVARFEGEYAAGSIALGSAPEEQARVPPLPTGPVPHALATVPTVREALAWARFPVVRVGPADATGTASKSPISATTCTFVMSIAADGTVADAHLERGGSVGELLRRWRQSSVRDPPDP